MLTHVKSYRSANLLACNQFISDPFPWKETGLGRVGGERQSFRAKQGDKRAAEDQGGQPPGSLRPSGLRAKSVKSAPSPPERERESFVLRTYIVGGIGGKKLHID